MAWKIPFIFQDIHGLFHANVNFIFSTICMSSESDFLLHDFYGWFETIIAWKKGKVQ